jgi:DNA-binding response OmpR family regulator
MGADDFEPVPFSPRELVARLRALIRRASRVSPEGVYVFADVDFSRTEITRSGEKIYSYSKGIQDTGVLDEERPTRDLKG